MSGAIDVQRILVLLRKEWLDLRRNYGALAPIALVTLLAMVLPFVVTFGIPAWTGERLAGDSDLVRLGGRSGAPDWLSEEGRVQYFLLQQFLLLFLLTPITGAMALAAHAIVGEKQARTLEPLLATPISTVELLVAKVLGALLPSLAMSAATLVLYLAGIAWLGEPRVAAAMLNGRTAVLAGWVGPTASLVSLQAAILVSSRVNDARTAQQVGVLIIVPLTGLVVAQFAGAVWVTSAALGLLGFGLLALWLILVLASVVMFKREAILTRWR
jgi:ABC-2 type transport system permease protein